MDAFHLYSFRRVFRGHEELNFAIGWLDLISDRGSGYFVSEGLNNFV